MKAGVRLSDFRMDKLFSHLDENRSGAVDYREFMKQLAQCSRGSKSIGELPSWIKGEIPIQQALVRDAIRGRFQDAQQVDSQ